MRSPPREDGAGCESWNKGKLGLPCALCTLGGELRVGNMTPKPDPSAASVHWRMRNDRCCWDRCGLLRFWGQSSEIFHCRYHRCKRSTEELKFTEFSRSAYGPGKIYQKNVRCQWSVLNVNIIHLAASVSYCSLACSSRGSAVWKGVSGGAAAPWLVWKGFSMSCTSPCSPRPIPYCRTDQLRLLW